MDERKVIASHQSTQCQYFLKREWGNVRDIIGDHLFKHLLLKYLFFERTSEGSLVQFAGTSVFEYLVNGKYQKKAEDDHEKKTSKCCKYNIKDKDDHYLNNIDDVMWNNMKSRTRIFY